jgi:hypothetical protein
VSIELEHIDRALADAFRRRQPVRVRALLDQKKAALDELAAQVAAEGVAALEDHLEEHVDPFGFHLRREVGP